MNKKPNKKKKESKFQCQNYEQKLEITSYLKHLNDASHHTNQLLPLHERQVLIGTNAKQNKIKNTTENERKQKKEAWQKEKARVTQPYN